MSLKYTIAFVPGAAECLQQYADRIPDLILEGAARNVFVQRNRFFLAASVAVPLGILEASNGSPPSLNLNFTACLLLGSLTLHSGYKLLQYADMCTAIINNSL